MASPALIYSEALPPEVRGSLFFAHLFCAENGFYPTMESMMSAMRTFNAAAKALADAKNVPFLDFERAVPKTRAYFSDDVHLTTAGNEILARMVFDWIVGHSLIAARSPSSSERATSHFPKTMQVSSPAR
jgi:lysophospholipase L1-like esterase